MSQQMNEGILKPIELNLNTPTPINNTFLYPSYELSSEEVRLRCLQMGMEMNPGAIRFSPEGVISIAKEFEAYVLGTEEKD